jgi:hypothetical protein
MDLTTVPSPRPGLPLSATLPLQLTSRPTKHDDSKAGTSDVKDKTPDNRNAMSMAKVCSQLSQLSDNISINCPDSGSTASVCYRKESTNRNPTPATIGTEKKLIIL